MSEATWKELLGGSPWEVAKHITKADVGFAVATENENLSPALHGDAIADTITDEDFEDIERNVAFLMIDKGLGVHEACAVVGRWGIEDRGWLFEPGDAGIDEFEGEED